MSNQNIKKKIENEIRLLRMASLASDLLPDNSQFDFPIQSSVSVGVTSLTIHIRLPYSIKAIRQYRKLMGKGWKMDFWATTQHDHSVSKHASFIRPILSPDEKDFLNPVRISLAMDTALDKSVCHIEPDGVKEVSVWKVVCE